ncbi:MAG TPA: hypothetical protein VLJ83_06740 [Gemmatimonadaceae bacterium]|nr:hypothetical protein [Gemmatimonadaceae bacterium]
MKKALVATLALAALPVLAVAQQPAPDTTRPAPPPATPAPAQPTASISIPIDFSGVLFANYQYQGAKGPTHSQNKFDLERTYLTFRMPAGDRASIRATLDVFQQGTTPNDAFYRGWVIRAKYAYLQYDLIKSASWNANIRGGLLHTVVIDHIESFWPRWISQTPVERAGFFSSADAGVATLWTLPNKFGEFYATVTNGPGYTSREVDRFKDYAARLSITPFSGSSNKIFKSFAVTGWTYVGAVASGFVNGGPAQVGPVGSSLPRTRAGFFTGVRDPRFSAGAEWDTRKDAREAGANTLTDPRVEIDSTGRLIAGFAVLKPFQLLNASSTFPLGLVARWDRFKPNTDTDGYINTIIGGLTWDVTKKTAFSLDYQEQTPHSGATAAATKTYFLHLVANF